jgi:hypothetical protein
MESDERSAVTEDHIEWILRVRRDRCAFFGANLFSDPAWDVLLELLAARLGGRRVAFADLSHIAPPSTLARWIAALEERGHVVCKGPLEPDKMRVALSSESAAKMMRFLSTAPQDRPW